MNPTKWILFGFSSVFSIYVGFLLFDSTGASSNFAKFAYWNILACFGGFVIAALKAYQEDLKEWFFEKRNWIVLSIAIIASVFLYSREGGGVNITFDEHTISNVAKSLHYDRLSIWRESAALGIDETSIVDKRPILFQFLLATVHDIFGYSIPNAFYLNGFLTVILLLLVHVCTSKLYNRQAGWYAMLLACCAPILSQNSSGGGLETLNLVGILTCFLFTLKYTETPNSVSRFSALMVAVALFSHARYESPFLVFPIVIVVAIYWLRCKQVQITWPVVLVPISFIPIAWQHSFSAANERYKQYKYDSDGFFSFSYIDENLGHATNFLFSSNKFSANSPWLSIIGLLSLIILLTLSVTRNREWPSAKDRLLVAQVFCFSIIAEFILVLGFTYGQLDDPVVARLGLPLILLMLICSGLAFGMIHTLRPKLKVASQTLVLVCFLYALPLFSKHLYSDNNKILMRLEWMMNRHHQLADGNYLYISAYPQEFELNDIGNIGFQRAVAQPGLIKFHKDLGTWDEVFVIQTLGVQPMDGEIIEPPLPGHDPGPWFELETITEVSTTPLHITRLSKVTKIIPDLDDETMDKEIREKLLQSELSYMNPIDPEAYSIWLNSLP